MKSQNNVSLKMAKSSSKQNPHKALLEFPHGRQHHRIRRGY
jgi:hypothetical protein